MKGRNEFVSQLKDKTQLVMNCGIKSLIETIVQQNIDNECRDRHNAIQRRLEENIHEIKGFNLIIQLINNINRDLLQKQSKLFDKISRDLRKKGLNWDSDKCIQVFKHWIKFYSRVINIY